MECKEAREALEPFVDDELEAERSFAVDRHLAVCRRCRAELGEIQALDRRIRAACRASAPSAETRARVRARLASALDQYIALEFPQKDRRERHGYVLRRMTALAASAVFAALLFVGASAGPASAEFVHDHVVCSSLAASEDAILSDPRLLDRLCKEKAGGRARVLRLDEAGLHLLGGRACVIDGREYAHLIYGAPGKEPVSVFVGRRFLGFGGVLGPRERTEQAGIFDVAKVRCPSGTEYVLVAGGRRGAELGAALVAQVTKR